MSSANRMPIYFVFSYFDDLICEYTEVYVRAKPYIAFMDYVPGIHYVKQQLMNAHAINYYYWRFY